MLRSFILAAGLSLFLVAGTFGQQVIPHHQDKPPGPALTPQEAIAQMTVPEGFKVELVASEPDIVNPVAMTFDERGRTWITESFEYPRREPGPGRDRVKVLEDTDADGKADKFTVFAEGLNIPSGIAVGYGGVWVANSPDILFYPDADRDGKADGPPQTIVTGFGRRDTHELPNSLTWGPDGWLYGLNGVFNNSHVKYVKENPNYKEGHAGWPLTCALFRIHPRTREFQVFCEGTSNPWGIAIDNEGSFFISACVIDHLWHLVETGYYHRQGGPYPPFTWKIESIVKHKHQKAAYCGIHYFDSDAYPEQYRNKLYMGNIHGNCINSDKLQRDGSTYFATGEPDFLSANDAWFMPVVQKTGPDGCLYILDWYDRYHCYQDANRDPAGIDRLKGRLYRVRYKDTPRAKDFDLSKETDDQLIARLSAPNDFIRHTAQRLLSERNAPEIQQKLLATIGDASTRDVGRMHAIWALAGTKLPPLNHYDGSNWFSVLNNSSNSVVRSWGVRLGSRSPLWQKSYGPSTAGKQPADVALQYAIGAGKLEERLYGIKMITLVSVLAEHGSDKLIPHIVWQNLHPLLETHPEVFLEAITLKLQGHPGVAAIAPRAMERLLARKQFDAKLITELFSLLRDRAEGPARECLQLLAARVQSGELRGERLTQLRKAFEGPLAASTSPSLALDASLLAVSWNDTGSIERVRMAIGDSKLDSALRLRALAALIAAEDKGALPAAGMLIETSESDEFSGQVLTALGRLDDPKVATVVLTVYSALDPTNRPKAIELLTQRASWGRALMEAVAADEIPAVAINVNQVQKLVSLNDKDLTAAVAKHWGTVRTSRDPAREKFVTEMRTLIRTTSGDAHRGIEVFSRVCGQCHKIYGQGQDVGPDITANGRASFDQLLSNVFDPSLVIGASYQARTVLTTDGRVVTGLLTEDSPERVVLKVQGGKLETIARADVDAMKVSELSLMPEGLEKQLKPQEIVDLFAYITLDKPPSDPSARSIPGAGRQ